MEASAVIERIEELNLEVEVDGDVLWLGPPSAIPDELRPAIRENKEHLLRHYQEVSRAITQLMELPFPIGYKGFPEETVVGAEAYSDLIGISDPIKRKVRVLSWMLDHIRNETPLRQEMPPFYWDVKKEKHRLIHADYEQSGLPLECGYCNIPAFVDPTEDDDGQVL